MINIFQVASNDKSLGYLGTLFGSVNGVLTSPQGSSATSLLGTMFQTFNSIILAIGAIIIVYATIIGVLSTAHEGEFMGKKWNNIWVPVRTALGISALVPITSGYSGLQVVMMWIIVQGVGAADVLWTTALGYAATAGSVYAQIEVPAVQSTQEFQNLFRGLVCDASARIAAQAPNDGGSQYYCYDKASQHGNAGFCSGSTPQLNANATSYELGPAGSCGTLQLCDVTSACSGNSSSLQCMACQAQGSAIQSVVSSVLAPVASALAQADYNYRMFAATSSSTASGNNSSWSWIYSYCSGSTPPIAQNQCCINNSTSSSNSSGSSGSSGNSGNSGTSGNSGNNSSCQSGASFPPVNGVDAGNANDTAVKDIFVPYAPGLAGAGDFITAASNTYTAALKEAYTTYLAAQGNQDLSSQLSQAQSEGWFFAGAYYYELASMNNQAANAAIPQLSFSFSEPQADSSSPMHAYRVNSEAATTLLGLASSTSSTSAVAENLPQLSGVMTALGSSIADAFGIFSSAISGVSGNTANPLVTLQALGNSMMVIAEAIFVALVTAAFIMLVFANFNIWGFGTGGFSPLGPAMTGIFMLLIPAVLAFLVFLITFGALLAVYIPLIPYMIFTFGTIGWLISTIETMVAGPIVALGILTPGGQHEVLGSSFNGLMLLFNVFLRPSLMIFGLMAAMLMASIVVSMINTVFWTMVSNSNLDPSSNILGWIFFLVAYIFIIIGALNKAFALIYILPENVIRWIGGQAEKYGEEASVGEMKKGFEDKTSGAGEAMQGGGQKSSKVMTKQLKGRGPKQ